MQVRYVELQGLRIYDLGKGCGFQGLQVRYGELQGLWNYDLGVGCRFQGLLRGTLALTREKMMSADVLLKPCSSS